MPAKHAPLTPEPSPWSNDIIVITALFFTFWGVILGGVQELVPVVCSEVTSCGAQGTIGNAMD